MTIYLRKLTPLFAMLLLAPPFAANADPITIVGIAGGDDGGMVDVYTMTDWEQQAESAGPVNCVSSVGHTGQMCFQGENGAASDISIENDPTWWEYTHGNVYVTNQSWIEILLPPNTLAVSLWVGASFSGNAWIQSTDANGFMTTRQYFGVGVDNTSGFGIYSDGCSYINKIIVEPSDWGFGNISVSQGDLSSSCNEVPEPSPLPLILTGILGLALTRQLVAKKAKI